MWNEVVGKRPYDSELPLNFVDNLTIKAHEVRSGILLGEFITEVWRATNGEVN